MVEEKSLASCAVDGRSGEGNHASDAYLKRDVWHALLYIKKDIAEVLMVARQCVTDAKRFEFCSIDTLLSLSSPGCFSLVSVT